MKWDKFVGRVKGKHGEATCEMMDLHEPHWFCRFFRRSDDAMELAVQQFEEGELEQAHDWCTQKVKEHDERTGITAGAA